MKKRVKVGGKTPPPPSHHPIPQLIVDISFKDDVTVILLLIFFLHGPFTLYWACFIDMAFDCFHFHNLMSELSSVIPCGVEVNLCTSRLP
jgi:hypothetical protein